MKPTVTASPEVMEASPAPARSQSETARKLRALKRRHAIRLALVRLVIAAVFVAAWQIFAGTPGKPWVLISDYYVSRPSDVIDAIRSWIDRGILFPNIAVTYEVTFIGFILGALLGFLFGFSLGVAPRTSEVFTPFISALYSIPRLALVPLFILWFGLGIESKIAFVILIVFFLVFFNTYSGVRDVAQELKDVLRIMGARRWQIYLKVILPSAMTWIIAGLQVSTPYALVSAVTAEMLSSNQGMGYLIVFSSGQFYTAGVFAAITVLVLMSMSMMFVISMIERRVLRWKESSHVS